MDTISHISKIKVAPAPNLQKNNYVKNDLAIVNQSRFLIILEALLGINRLYLFQYNRIIIIISVFYSLFMLSGVLGMTFHIDFDTASTVAIKLTKSVEVIFFIIVALIYKRQIKTFFKNLATFDEMLNIQNDLATTNSSQYIVFWIFISLTVNIFDVGFRCLSFRLDSYVVVICIFMENLSHDLELVFFFTLLRSVYFRLLVLKAHVNKLFLLNASTKLNKVEKLSEKVRLSVTSLHRVYELLHQCSEQLNSTMNLPILIIFITSSLVTIMMLKKMITAFQTTGADAGLIIFIVYRCLKYTVLVVIPCYYSSVTAGQTTIIRTVLHDAVNNMPMSRTERRQVKAFFHLTRESDFSYAICGVIQLDMSLPLSYISLCTTYLVIVIQFSKFID